MLRYITGRGGSGIGGLSTHLKTLDDDYDALPIDAGFLRQDMQEQVDKTREFINLESGHVVANSYGAYLLTHAIQPVTPEENASPSDCRANAGYARSPINCDQGGRTDL